MENDFFNYSVDSGVSEQDFKTALQGLIEKGLVQEIVEDGQIKYKLTPMGRAVGKHLDSNHSDKN